MELSKVERLILSNQYRILEKLYPEEEDYYKNAQEILEQGYKFEYDSLISWMSDDVPEIICQEVFDVLQMYRSLYFSYEKLSDKSGIDEDDVIFGGFDGNEEIEHYMYAGFVIDNLKKYSEFKNVDVNSHSNRLFIYRPMLEAWRKHNRYGDLNKEQIIEIINAYESKD